ncbi:ATP-binding protein [uncultured Mesonia sp.]|uniref:tetratricopeptide repeat-containing sensor histidine kinase n=1 Tax=uncultured Mesonia sp. TaxID=399731 RepID=UPI00374EA46E
MKQINIYNILSKPAAVSFQMLKAFLILQFIFISALSLAQEQPKEAFDSIAYYQEELHKEDNPKSRADKLVKLAQNYNLNDRHDKASPLLFEALEIYKSLNLEKELAYCNYEIFNTGNAKNSEQSRRHLQAFYDYAKKKNNIKALVQSHLGFGVSYLSSKTYPKAKENYQKAIALARKIGDSLSLVRARGNLGLIHSGYENLQDSARIKYQKNIDYLQSTNEHELLVNNLINYANSYEKEKKFKLALNYINQAKEVPISTNVDLYHKVINAKLARYHYELGNYKTALDYMYKSEQLRRKINYEKQKIAIADLQEKYEAEKKEKENIVLKHDIEKKKKVQQLLWAGIISALVIGSLIVFLILKNARKKRELIRKEEQLKQKQIEKELKDQELNSIDTLIEGQEKERQRLAENLHDNLGATLAALKINLMQLQKPDANFKQQALQNGVELINDAYEKVRGMAHEKSTGVIAKKGLLPAIKKLANQFSTQDLAISVEDFGLDNRLDNSLEIRIYRIIQELLTNIIKHAKASQATISLTNHDSSLNIIVEDNGIGLPKNFKFSNQTGIGLGSIEKRVENLMGTIEIDSNPQRGTSIIINIPL